MKKYLQNNNGVTIIEILAALLILSIVLVTYMTFFIQSAKFTQHNNETLTTVQVAEAIVAKVRIGDMDVENLYEGYETILTIKPGPENTELKKAVISVKSLSEQSIEAKEFVIEMYFKEKPGENSP